MPRLANKILIGDRTVRAILDQPAPAVDTDYTDQLTPGFVLRHYRSGRAGYAFRYQWLAPFDPANPEAPRRKVPRRLPLGMVGEIEPEEAREKAMAARRAVRDGRDPAGPLPASKLDKNISLAVAIDLWHADQLSQGRVSADKRLRMLKRHILPHLGKDPQGRDRMLRLRSEDGPVIDGFTYGECKAALKAMRDSGLSGAVVDAQATLHGVFAFAREYGYVDANPMADMSYVVKPRKGDRALDLGELAAVWLAAEHLSAPTCAAVRLLMLLGQRCGEVDEMRRSELIEAKDLDHRLVSADERRALIKAGASLCFVLPVTRQKTRWKVEDPKPHIVPLPPQAIAIIDTQPKYSGGDYLFSHTNGRKPFGNWTEIRAALYEHAALKTPWTPRDLRASLVTGFANLLETPTGTAGKLCNHSPGKADGVTGKIYERSRRLAIVYRATCRWADAISAAVADHLARRSGANVVSLPV